MEAVMKTALMVIDVQEGMQPTKAHDGDGVVARIASLLDRARTAVRKMQTDSEIAATVIDLRSRTCSPN